jgi:hypothetical protein
MRVLITSGIGIEFPLGAGALFVGEIVGMRLAHCRDNRLAERSARSRSCHSSTAA